MFSDFGELDHHSCIAGRSHMNWFYKPFFPLSSQINIWLLPSGNDAHPPWKKRNPSVCSAFLSRTANKRKARHKNLIEMFRLHRVC